MRGGQNLPPFSGRGLNEKADELAKLALDEPEPVKRKFPVDDFRAILQHHKKQQRQNTWEQLGGELQMHDIKPQLGPWTSSRQNSRHKEVMLTRLRTGRTCLNAHWVDREQCPFCNSTTEPTVEHILLECSLLTTPTTHQVVLSTGEHSFRRPKFAGRYSPTATRAPF